MTQGEDANPLYVNRIGTRHFELPPGRAAEQPIQVTYQYDLNQRMHCTFEDKESGRVLEVDFSMNDEAPCPAETDSEQEQVVQTVEVQ